MKVLAAVRHFVLITSLWFLLVGQGALGQGTFDPSNAAPNIGLTNGSTTATDGVPSPIPAANDVTPNWQAAGLQSIGGIPSGRTQCGSTLTPSGVLPPNASDDAHVIQAAIASCTLGQSLHLNGDFILDLTQVIFLNRGISLFGEGGCTRGGSNVAPECHTTLTHYNGAIARYNGAVCAGTTTFVGGISGTTLTVTSVVHGTIASGQTIYPGSSGTQISSGSGLSWVVNNSQTISAGTTFYVGNTCTTNNSLIYVSPTSTFDYGWGLSGKACGHSNPCDIGIPLVSDAVKGDSTIFLTTTTGLSVGNDVLIDERSQAIYQPDPVTSLGSTWAAYDFQTPSTTPVTGRAFWAKHTTSFPTDDFSGNNFPFNVASGNIGCGYGMNCDRVTSEVKKIASINSGANSITFDTPLTIGMRVIGGVGVQFQGYISTGTGSTTPGQVLTVTSILSGGNNLGVNQPLWWGTQTAGAATWYTGPTNSGTGTGGTGTYTVSNAQNGGSSGNVNVGSAGSPVTFCSNCGNAQVLLPQSQSGVATTMLTGAGVESISVGRAVEGAVTFNECDGCWILNSDLWGWINGGVNLQNSRRVEIRGNYIHDGYDLENNGVEYAVAMNAAACETLIIDNIIMFAGKSMVGRAGCGGNVIANNYLDKTQYQAGVIGNQFIDESANCSHYTGPHHCLFEGNWAEVMGDDNTHGNSVYHTYYRNFSPGYRTDFNDPSFTTRHSVTYNPTNAPVSDLNSIGFANGQSYPYTNGNGPQRGYGTQMWNYFNAVVGNVLGVSGVSTSGNNWDRLGLFTNNKKHMYMLGANYISPYATDPNLTPGVAPWIFIDANFENLGGTQTFAASAHAIPNSLVWTSAPYSTTGAACTYPWPWVDPAGATNALRVKNASGPGGCSGISGLPAKARYDAGTPLGQNP